jgi:valyl-tRNA synthetase
MDKAYDPQATEQNIYKLWEEGGYFAPKNDAKKPFTIIMPPPNANDPLHIGHAMFVTIEDILIRYHRMKGEASLWVPGTDHAGIETQFVFEKKLAKQDKSRFNFDRETLYKMIWDYVQENSDVAVNQMKKLGASADWSKFKFTLDPDIVERVLETFIKLHKDKLIYRGQKLINYCTKCGTGYSELEVEHQEETTKLYYIKYGPFVLATTRPETKFADTAVAVHPKDKRYKKYIGQEIEVIGLLRTFRLKVIADDYVDPEFGTGVVKITPYHDFNDFDVWQRHLDEIPSPKQVIDKQGKLTDVAGKYAGMKIKAAREQIEKDLDEKGLLAKPSEAYTHNVSVCYRCKTVLEPLPLTQFFIKTKPLVEGALKALDTKETVVLGAGQEKILRHWLTNIRDWNVSRQIVWGIRIPVWYNVQGHESRIWLSFLDHEGKQKQGTLDQYLRDNHFTFEHIKTNLQQIDVGTWSEGNNAPWVVSIDEPKEDGLWIQETDTFDTWFSSGQWPVVTLQANGEDIFKKFYPTSVMETGYDILPIWVMRMMLLGIYATGKSPFETVYLHGLVRDEKGQKMSKSKGNVINPLDMVDKYGADAIRIALIMSSTPGQDKAVGESTIRGMRNFANKIWNAARFLHMKQGASSVTHGSQDEAFTKRLATTTKKITKLLDTHKVGLAAEVAYHEFWHWFCDETIEQNKQGNISDATIHQGLTTFLKLLHPFVPFVTETVWEKIGDGKQSPLITTQWPA